MRDNPWVLNTPFVRYYAGVPLRTNNGHNIGILSVIDYIPRELSDEQKLIMKELGRKIILELENNRYKNSLIEENEECEMLSKQKDEFLINMSHEIRTPLNSIYGFTELLFKTSLNNKQMEYLSIIKSSVENLILIINDILDYSKIESGKLSLEKIFQMP